MSKGLDSDGHPTVEGVYLAKGMWGDWKNEKEIEVYHHPIKGLCCYQEDFGSAGTEEYDETDCHVSVQCTGLDFITRIRDLK
jgi:hypothetical protein